MKLYLIQHGEAKSEAEDPERSLTPHGENELTAVSKMAKELHLRPSKVFHSGKLRAKQTAEIIAHALNIPNLSVMEAKGLNPNDEVRSWAERVSEEREDLMLVGHLPSLRN